MTTIHIEIDGKTLEVCQGKMLIEVADEAGITIPRFCYHKKLSIAANCRMCLVEVANSGKPLPACATPVSEGMKVFTTSSKAKDAQRAVMEFLLINHPLDCPICDQGGQCELQDVALEYGRNNSRYTEAKRVVEDKNLGPLISTDMTRCIHCTRCVRFGTEIAGVQEMGATGRGEFVKIGTYIEKSIDSELSGNIIDLCPVGALTSKPFRFKARAWELRAFPGISMHDGVGSHTWFHVRNNQVMRVLPRENESLNEVWLSDRDRFSYTALYHPQRLQTPYIKRNGVWEAVDWQTALAFAVEKLRAVVDVAGPDQLGALISANATVEEAYLFQKLFREIGCHNIDHRLRMIDDRQQAFVGAYPHWGIRLSELEHQEGVILVGSDIHKEQPIIAHRVRRASLHGAKVVAVSPYEIDTHFECQQVVGDKGDLVSPLLGMLKALVAERALSTLQLPSAIIAMLSDATISDAAQIAINAVKDKKKISILLGQYAITHPQASVVYALSRWIAFILEGTWGEMSVGANSAGAWLAGAVPHRLPLGQSNEGHEGLTAYQMWHSPRQAYVLMNVEPEYEAVSPSVATTALQQASAVVVLSIYDNPHYRDYADVLLPITPPCEMAGTTVNALGEWQGFQAATMPWADSRPAWKVLRVLANLWGVKGFHEETIGEVLKCILAMRETLPHYADNLLSMPCVLPEKESLADNQWVRLAPVSLYGVDNIVRRALPLQQTRDAQWDYIKMHPEDAAQRGWEAGQDMWVIQDGQRSAFPLPIVLSTAIPLKVVWVPSGREATRTLGEPFGIVELVRHEDMKA